MRRNSAIFLICMLSWARMGQGCGSGNSNEFEIITNPQFTMHISPPVGWTYFPTVSSDTLAIWYFVGQSNDTTTANTRATAEIQASMIEALLNAQVPTQGVTINDDYQPIQIENPIMLTGAAKGPLYGKVEGGAVTQTATGPTTALPVFTAYNKQMTVTLMNLRSTRFTLNIVKNDFIQRMSTKYNVKFVGDVIIT